MPEIWTIVLVVAVAVPVFLLLRWLAVRRAITQAEKRRRQGGPGARARRAAGGPTGVRNWP